MHKQDVVTSVSCVIKIPIPEQRGMNSFAYSVPVRLASFSNSKMPSHVLLRTFTQAVLFLEHRHPSSAELYPSGLKLNVTLERHCLDAMVKVKLFMLSVFLPLSL
jgi:hypothetical protein